MYDTRADDDEDIFEHESFDLARFIMTFALWSIRERRVSGPR
jgi:hypothetical protein